VNLTNAGGEPREPAAASTQTYLQGFYALWFYSYQAAHALAS
jgi:hypothetical protein